MNQHYKYILLKLDKKFIKKVVLKLKKLKPNKIDEIIHLLHDEVFSEINCLDCGNCCLTIGPAISDKDIQRIAKHLKIKPSVFLEKYLQLDNDGFYMYNTKPCPFIDSENYCSIYSVRPKACVDYPHTDRTNFYQLINLSIKNCETCPAVALIFEKLDNQYNFKLYP